MKQETIKVVFRKHRDTGDVLAVFPTIPEYVFGYKCRCYQQMGQHGRIDPFDAVAITYPCKSRAEYKNLLNELISIGYDNLRIGERFSRHDRKKCMDEARAYRQRCENKTEVSLT